MGLATKDYLHAFTTSRWKKMAVLSLIALLCVIQVVTILASRSHYTIDIVVACYTTVLLWTVLWDRWPDPCPTITDLVVLNDISMTTK